MYCICSSIIYCFKYSIEYVLSCIYVVSLRSLGEQRVERVLRLDEDGHAGGVEGGRQARQAGHQGAFRWLHGISHVAQQPHLSERPELDLGIYNM